MLVFENAEFGGSPFLNFQRRGNNKSGYSTPSLRSLLLDLTWDDHLSRVWSSCYRKLRGILRYKSLLPDDSILTLHVMFLINHEIRVPLFASTQLDTLLFPNVPKIEQFLQQFLVTFMPNHHSPSRIVFKWGQYWCSTNTCFSLHLRRHWASFQTKSSLYHKLVKVLLCKTTLSGEHTVRNTWRRVSSDSLLSHEMASKQRQSRMNPSPKVFKIRYNKYLKSGRWDIYHNYHHNISCNEAVKSIEIKNLILNWKVYDPPLCKINDREGKRSMIGNSS